MRRELTERATAWDTGVRRDTPLDLTSGHTAARTLVERSRLLGLVVGSALSRGWGSYLVGLGQNAERLEAANGAGVGREAGTAQAASGEDGPAKRTAPRVRGLPSVQGPDRGSRSTRNIRTPTVTSPPWSR